MKIFVAGATGVVGRRLIPALVQAGHEVVGTTRRADRTASIEEQKATPVVLDVLDAAATRAAVAEAAPDVIVHQLTDLAGRDFDANSRLRIEGTRNLVDAAKAAGVERMVAQSIAWVYVPGSTPAVETDPLDASLPPYAGVAALESAVGELPRGVILRYGALYGPGTWYARDGFFAEQVRRGEQKQDPGWTSFVHVDDAATASVAALEWPAGPVNIVDDEPALAQDWLPVYSAALDAPAPPQGGRHAAVLGRPVSNARARDLGWKPSIASWRDGFEQLG
ncbi:UDP-glucose 4-epimerase [Actinomadura rubteroloni]|uniref:UDP-glucose 4-epimerase n=1 Tax=Actinomadura rubteroloni TaxID=1926885 RepID=A0A2P4UKV8_9ACTN|nr:NAD(P)-dependent oxidoreductase [Actinomadura rubteroloni]POM25693.1 UDP-glucose 4-epimerase [Actinomadura rubteroloni]